MNGNIADYVKIIDAIDVMVWIIKEDGTIIAINNQITKRLGYSRDEVMGMSVLDFHPADRAEEALRILTKLNDSSEVVCPLPLVTKEGKHIESETHILKGRWEGEPVLFGLSRDITHQKLIELKYSILFKYAPLPMLISRVDDGLIYEVNDAWKKLLQYENYDLTGKTVYELGLYPDKLDRSRLIQKFLNQGYLEDEKISFIRRDGAQLFGTFSASSIEFDNQKYWITVYVDKTEQHKIQAELDALKVASASMALNSIKQQLAGNKYIIDDAI